MTNPKKYEHLRDSILEYKQKQSKEQAVRFVKDCTTLTLGDSLKLVNRYWYEILPESPLSLRSFPIEHLLAEVKLREEAEYNHMSKL
jgi:hypothetical protein